MKHLLTALALFATSHLIGQELPSTTLKTLDGQSVNIKDAITIEQLNEDSILSIESAFPNFLNINLSSNETKFFLNGVKIKSQNYPDAIYKTYSDKGIFLGLGEVQDSNLKLKQLV